MIYIEGLADKQVFCSKSKNVNFQEALMYLKYLSIQDNVPFLEEFPLKDAVYRQSHFVQDYLWVKTPARENPIILHIFES